MKKASKKSAKKEIEPNFLVKFSNKKQEFSRTLQIFALNEPTAWLWVDKQKEEWKIGKDFKVEVSKL